MIMKLVTGMKLDVFDTMVTKNFVISLLLRKYVVITLILAESKALVLDARNSWELPSRIQLKFGIRRYFWVLISNIKSTR